jgi:SAM-dependent methyltransferase
VFEAFSDRIQANGVGIRRLAKASYTPAMNGTPSERWLAATWPLVYTSLPAPPARVIDVGCGSLGGFVPTLHANGYDALGVDPKAPDGEDYQRIEFERAELPPAVDAVVASTSLHHVADPAHVIDRITSALVSGGVVVVVEWASERFDQKTAQWCFDHLGPDDEAGWLHRRRDEWLASGRQWSGYLRDWFEREGLHAGETLVRLLDERFERRHLAYGPYFFPDLAGTTAAEEQKAIDAGRIRAGRIDYVGGLASGSA